MVKENPKTPEEWADYFDRMEKEEADTRYEWEPIEPEIEED